MEEETYAIAILRQTYTPDLQGDDIPIFLMEDGGSEIQEFTDLNVARDVIRDFDHEIYYTQHNEVGRPEYLIVTLSVAEYIHSGRYGDGGRYDWDFECTTPWKDGSHCGECNACIQGLINEDRQYLLDNRVDGPVAGESIEDAVLRHVDSKAE